MAPEWSDRPILENEVLHPPHPSLLELLNLLQLIETADSYGKGQKKVSFNLVIYLERILKYTM